MSITHWFLQGKGGVGKSLAACLLAQYLPDKSFKVRCYDADPINSTFASFAALTAPKVDLIEASDKGRRINPRRFDNLVEQIAGHPADAHIIVDTGSSAFVPLVHSLSPMRCLRYSPKAAINCWSTPLLPTARRWSIRLRLNW